MLLSLAHHAEPIERISPVQLHDLWRLYQEEWWTKGRSLDETRRAVEGAQILFGYQERGTGKLVGFTRVLTDFIVTGLVMDVIVAREWRKTGMGKALIDRVVQHPQLRLNKRLELYCRRELIPFYEKWGFQTASGPVVPMRRLQEG